MAFHLQASSATVALAIDAFNPRYHADYFAARASATRYLSAAPSYETVLALAQALEAALTSWGAGRRSAPGCHSIEAMAQALREPQLHAQLKALAASKPFLMLRAGERGLARGCTLPDVQSFDKALIDSLHSMSRTLMVGNTNVTYPMKALLLITGLMPALDSQVKGGLALAGLAGVNRTRYLLPAAGSRDAMKICALPFYLADCATRSRLHFDAAIAASGYPALQGEYGRVFDVLLFMQRASTAREVFLTFAPTLKGQRWYMV